MARIGVLALQGGFASHLAVLRRLGHQSYEVRRADELAALDGLVLPGGESTTQLKLIALGGLAPALHAFVAQGRPVLATCAGLILAARHVCQPAQESFGWLDITVQRNAYGRQLDSCETVSARGLALMFIRAPRIITCGAQVEVLDRWAEDPVLVRQGAVVGASFHPELTDSAEVHQAVFGLGQPAQSVGPTWPRLQPSDMAAVGQKRSLGTKTRVSARSERGNVAAPS